MEYLVEGTQVLSKENLQKITAGGSCGAVCGVNCSVVIGPICLTVCRVEQMR